MLDFTTTDDWVFNLRDPEPVAELSEPSILPYISDPKSWEQYNDLVIYEADKLVRQWIELMSKNTSWCSNKNKRRYTMKMIYEQCTGKQWDVEAAKKSNRWAKVLSYYSTRIQNSGSIAGKQYTKTIYTISPKRYKRLQPYSLRLRLEWLADRGDVPSYQNMRLPKDDLTVGHARNPKTEANMQARKQRAKEIYNERYADRKH